MAEYPDADILSGESLLQAVQILPLDDPIFDPRSRPTVETALQLITGQVGNWTVPFASATFEHHRETQDQGLFRCLFGRDSLVICSLLGPRWSSLERNVLLALGEHQGSGYNPASEEEVGRIPHEIREKNDPQALRITFESGWEFPYYGSIDATLLWLSSLEKLSRMDASFLDYKVNGESIGSRAEGATQWLLEGIVTGGGVLRSHRSNVKGILNQVWKDSGDSYLTQAGDIALEPGTASIETIGESFDALNAAAKLAARSSKPWALSPSQLRSVALALRATVLDDWWLGDRFAMGSGRINGQEAQLDAIASNQWRLLDSTLLDGPEFADYRGALIDSVCDPSMLGPNGIRTLASSNPRYRPAGYHTGSSWPVDSALIVRGLIRHGAFSEAAEITSRTLSAVEGVGAYPELFRSDQEEPAGVSRFIIDVWDPGLNSSNRVSQPPQLIQGWTVAAYDYLDRQRKRLGLDQLSPNTP